MLIHDALPAALLGAAGVLPSPAFAYAPLPQSEILIFKAAITEKSVDNVLALLRSRLITQIRITSWGGNEYDAARLGLALKRHGVEVTAEQYCISSCVVVLLSASKSVIADNTLVALHPSSYSTYEWARGSKSGVADLIRKDSKRAYQALRSVGFSSEQLKLLRAAFSNARPRCADSVIIEGHVRSRIFYERPLWIPTRQSLERAGIRVRGFWPASAQKAFAFAAKFLKVGTGLSFGDAKETIQLVHHPVNRCRS